MKGVVENIVLFYEVKPVTLIVLSTFCKIYFSFNAQLNFEFGPNCLQMFSFMHVHNVTKL